MKVLLFLSFLVFVVSCKPEVQPPVAEEVTPEATLAPKDTISPQTFLDWTNSWKVNGKGYIDTSLTLYHTMPVIDLEETIGETPVSARFYNGLEDLGGGHYKAHLILAGIDASGGVIGNYFDISNPCPADCGN